MQFSDILFEKAQKLKKSLGLKTAPTGRIAHMKGKLCEVPIEERAQTPMHRAFYENTGAAVHKWRHYLSVYDRHLSHLRNTPLRLLEIGVFKGGSMQLWRQYFGPDATIFGIDIDPACAAFNGAAGQVRIGSQADTTFLKSIVAEMGGIDVVIDDGSHVAQHQRASFEVLFPALDERGVYICEDTHSSYWPGYFGGGVRRGFVAHMKKLVDDIHADFHINPQTVQDAHRCINSVHFYNSMVVIEKMPHPSPSHLLVPGD